MFEDRADAGCRLALAVEKYKDENALVLAIPRGGVQVAYQIAKHINTELSIVISRKLPFPYNPEAGFGAIAEDGSIYLFPHASRLLSQEIINQIIRQQREEVKRRIKIFRGAASLPAIEGRTVILVDDGIAMGSTMRVSIMLCKNKNAEKIIVAVPVAGPDTAKEIGKLVDEIVVLETPPLFQAVAEVYLDWYDVPDSEVIETMKLWHEEK